MNTTRLRAALVAAATGLAVLTAAQPAARAQQNCVVSGAPVVPVPWSQQLLAPDRVWPLSTGAGQRVAVVSTGTADNPQLAGHVAERATFAPADAGQPSGSPDCVGTGTGVSGIIAAQPSSVVGFHGVAPGAQILSAKVVGDQYPPGRQPSGTVAPQTLAAGINWAVDRNASVIAVPTITYEDNPALRGAVQRALSRNIVVVAAVGQRASNEPPGLVPYPAGYDGVIGVGSLAENGEIVQDSRPTAVDLVAPGANVVTTYPNTGLGTASGTEFATAYVAGTAALVRAHLPELSTQDVAKRLFATAAPAPEGTGSALYGYGVVNPYQAVSDDVVAGNPVALPPLTPATIPPDVAARQAAEERSDDWALGLAAGGLALILLVTAIVVFGPRGRRRRWRSGLAPVPQDRPEDERPEPPVELFSDRPKRS
ncbi:S8 family serine peptidase [Amycolatopsis thermophila]|uniref:Type VII secretion-associated serine protease mycosin n=1 Tax=Amycolatopsis thermophila TaxID=206084 RepID=A0ABU0ELI9_9PSEU|nr:S8 family serine peptidase [Amycolatopsis thermophila]MDQ0376144.1 type VII secretion-associated serine protease mycosin [Amycolatopsis thermophila]